MLRFHKRLIVLLSVILFFVVFLAKYRKTTIDLRTFDSLELDFYPDYPKNQHSESDEASTEETQVEKFLAYLPHSGFHNQRIALENAILLASYLNRTLLVPPVYLGDAQAWKPFDELQATLEKRTKSGMVSCARYLDMPAMKRPKKCASYIGWTMLPWSTIYSLDSLQGFIRFIERDDMSISSLEQYGIDIQQDIHYLKDTSLYDYRIFDHFPEGYIVGKYQRKIMVSELQQIPDKLLHIGSIFGNLRVTTLQHKSEYKFILDNLQFTNPGLMQVSRSIVSRLGGRGNYLGIHLRVGDGSFSNSVKENARDILRLMTQMLAMTNRDDLDDMFEDERPSLGECLDAANSPIVYLATDASNPRERLDFSAIFERFPCTFTLKDFTQDLTGTNEVNPWDGTSIIKYLIPMVDAVTAANGEFYVGTNQSTFSMFVRRMHNHYLGRADPLNLKY